jgi:hypothetical protein
MSFHRNLPPASVQESPHGRDQNTPGIIIEKNAVLSLQGATVNALRNAIWLPFPDPYRTMCLAPQPEFLQVLEELRQLELAA